MLILDCVKKKIKISVGDQNGVGCCPFLVLGRNITVVSRQEGQRVHDRRACTHDLGPAQVHAGEPGKAYRDKPPWALCCDKEFPVVIEKASSGSRQRPWCHDKIGLVGGVAIRARNREHSVCNSACNTW